MVTAPKGTARTRISQGVPKNDDGGRTVDPEAQPPADLVGEDTTEERADD